MKKNKILFVILIISFIFTNLGCSTVTKSYTLGEENNYTTTQIHKGGDLVDEEINLNKIWYNSWLGDYKVILEFDKTENMPIHQVSYNEGTKEIIVVISQVITENTEIENYEDHKMIENISINKVSKNNPIIKIALKDDISYRIDESCEEGLMVINLK